MFIAVLGREPKISLAELEAFFGSDNVSPLSPQLATVKSDHFPIERLGGTIKAGKILDSPLIETLAALPEGKITLGFSDYSAQASARSANTQALKLKSILKRHNRSVRIIPNNATPTLSSATSHHNQLGEKPRHIEVISFGKLTALSIGTQNISAYAERDQARPARDAFVGMLPPKLAQILVNLATLGNAKGILLDPFCGTGTVLQEAMLMGYATYGSDLSEKMVKYSDKNLKWLRQSPRHKNLPLLENKLELGDATKHHWQTPIDFVASEVYLGQPFSAPPSDIKLKEVKYTTQSILLSFLKNLGSQIQPGTTLALAVPAWRRTDNSFSHLNILDEIEKLGYNLHQFKHAMTQDLLYYRENQVVARQIIVLRKI